MEELKQIKLFAKCSNEALERLLSQPCRRQEYPAGRRMFNPGDPCRALMVLVKGLKNRVVEYLETNGSITSVADVAQQLGATRPSLSRVLSDMMDEGLVVKDGKGYRKA